MKKKLIGKLKIIMVGRCQVHVSKSGKKYSNKKLRRIGKKIILENY